MKSKRFEGFSGKSKRILENESGNPYATFTFKVKDNSGAYSDDTYTMTINVTAGNDNPTGGNNDVTTDENVSYTFAVEDFTFNDIDGHTFAGIKIISVDTVGDLEYNGVDVVENTECPDITQLVFKILAGTSNNQFNWY